MINKIQKLNDIFKKLESIHNKTKIKILGLKKYQYMMQYFINSIIQILIKQKKALCLILIMKINTYIFIKHQCIEKNVIYLLICGARIFNYLYTIMIIK